MNLYDVYQIAVDNNDGNHVDKLIIHGVEYELYTYSSWGVFEVILKVGDTGNDDVSIVIYSPSGNIIYKNTNPYYYDILKG